MHNDLLTISQAAEQYQIPIAALIRMDTEGLAMMIKRGTDYYFRADDLRRVAEYAKNDPRFLTCTCIGGPCYC